MSRADSNPDEAEADMRRLSDEVGALEDALDEAREHRDKLEDEMGSASGDKAADLERQHAENEQRIADLETDLQSKLTENADSQTFWFDDDEDD